MQPQKNQFELAELKFGYQASNQTVFTTEPAVVAKLLSTVFNDTATKSSEFYVLFASDCEIICWYLLPDITDLFSSKQQIIGLAIACNATNVVLAQCSDSKKAKFDSFDRLLVVSLFAACEKAGVNIIDYLLCHAGNYYSFIKEELLN